MHANLQFDYVRPDTLEEALAVLEENGKEARIMAGGTELLVNMKQHAVMPKVLIDIQSIPGVQGITDHGDNLRIGARTLLRAIEGAQEIKRGVPMLAEAVRSIATAQIRNLGTIGGNICQTVKCQFYNQTHINLFMREAIAPCRQKGGKVCHAQGIDSLTHAVLGKSVNGCVATTPSDLAAPLCALDAKAVAAGPEGKREIPMEGFFVGGGRTALRENEILTHITVPILEGEARARYLKYSHGTRNFPILGLAAVLRSDQDPGMDAGIVISGISPQPLRLSAVQKSIRDGKSGRADIAQAFQRDVKAARQTGEESAYKLKRARVMVQDALEFLLEQ